MPCNVAQKCCASLQGTGSRRARTSGALEKENVAAGGAEDGVYGERAAGAIEDKALRRTYADDGWGAVLAALPAIKAFLQAAAIAKVATGYLPPDIAKAQHACEAHLSAFTCASAL